MPVSVVRHLGIYVDADVSMSTHVSRTVAACFASLHQLRSICQSVLRSVLQSLVSSIVLQRLDYGNATLSGIPSHLTKRMQTVLNSATTTLLLGLCFLHRGTTASRHVATPGTVALAKVPERIKFKLAVLVYKFLHQTAPPYLAEELHPSSTDEARQRLRSASTSSLVVLRTRLSTIGDRDFPVAAPDCGTLPLNVTSTVSISGFRIHLKTHPFPESPVAPVHFVIFGHYNRYFNLRTCQTPLRGMAGPRRVVICSHCGLTRLYYHKN